MTISSRDIAKFAIKTVVFAFVKNVLEKSWWGRSAHEGGAAEICAWVAESVKLNPALTYLKWARWQGFFFNLRLRKWQKCCYSKVGTSSITHSIPFKSSHVIEYVSSHWWCDANVKVSLWITCSRENVTSLAFQNNLGFGHPLTWIEWKTWCSQRGTRI